MAAQPELGDLPRPASGGFGARTWFVGAVVFALAITAAFASSATSPFLHFDDPLYVVSNGRIQAHGLRALLALWDPREAQLGRFIEYFPLRDTVYWCIWQVFGDSPTAFHITSQAWHLAVSLLVVALGSQLRLSTWACWISGLVFAVHPGHLESVIWISALKDPMYASFLLAAVLCHSRSVERGQRRVSKAALGFLTLSLLSKSMGFTAPVLFWLVERYASTTPAPTREVARRLVIPGIICAVFLVHFLWVAHANDVITPPHGGSWGRHVVVAFWAFTRYLQQAIIPYDFEFNRCFFFPDGARDPRFALAVVVAVAYVIALVRVRGRPLPHFLLAWFVVCLFPVMNILPFPALVADRYLYAPSVAVCFALGIATEFLRWRLRVIVVVLVLCCLGAVTALRGALWHREWLLWQNTADDEACVDAGYPHLYLATALIQEDPRAALESYHRGINSRGFSVLPVGVRCAAYAMASRAALMIGDHLLAQRHIDVATTRCPDQAFVWQFASTVYSAAKNRPLELEAAERAAALSEMLGPQDFGRGAGKPGLPLLWNRAVARFRAGKIDSAAADFLACIEEDRAGFCAMFDAWRVDTAGQEGAAQVVTLVAPACSGR